MTVWEQRYGWPKLLRDRGGDTESTCPVMSPLTEQGCAVRELCCCANIIEYTCSNLDGAAYRTPRLQAYPLCHCTKRHEIKLSARDRDATKRHSTQETYEAAAGVTRCTV